ncbi:PH domain-containing protein [Rhizohabitans arisaemae]|uniref:PH domain-containing protein n=1 Tax=Rhizohabitans arisaemae TaxID=2720610 RepID=UPI0024B0CAA5|nr:PH domain-containing protein [Rhizohabitans arisaemae]
MTAPFRDPAHRVSRRAIAMWLAEAVFGYVLMVGAALLVASWFGGDEVSWLPGWLTANLGWLPVALGAVLAPFVVLEPFRRYAVHRWELRDDVVFARSGWINREWVFVPVSRIQTVDKKQGWLERLLGLGTLEIKTASYAGSSSIKGLEYAVAARLAEELAHRAHELRDDAT